MDVAQIGVSWHLMYLSLKKVENFCVRESGMLINRTNNRPFSPQPALCMILILKIYFLKCVCWKKKKIHTQRGNNASSISHTQNTKCSVIAILLSCYDNPVIVIQSALFRVPSQNWWGICTHVIHQLRCIILNHTPASDTTVVWLHCGCRASQPIMGWKVREQTKQGVRVRIW